MVSMQLHCNGSIAIPIRPTTFCHLIGTKLDHSLNIGVSLCSIIRPLLFLIYITDIVNSSTEFSFVLFADDTTVYVQLDSVDRPIQILNSELAKVAAWVYS